MRTTRIVTQDILNIIMIHCIIYSVYAVGTKHYIIDILFSSIKPITLDSLSVVVSMVVVMTVDSLPVTSFVYISKYDKTDKV